MISQLIGAFVAVVIGVALFFPIQGAMQQAKFEINATGADETQFSQTMLDIVPGFFAFIFILIAFGVAYSALRPLWKPDDYEPGENYEDEEDTDMRLQRLATDTREQMGDTRHKRLGSSAVESSGGCRLPTETKPHMPETIQEVKTRGEEYFK